MTDRMLPSPATPDVWTRLASTTEPIFIYGTGNGADKIMDELMRREIPVEGVFASDGFVRNREFRGYHVSSYGDVCRDHPHFIVVLAFGSSRPEVLANIDRIAVEQMLLCPDVPAFGDTLFDSDYYKEHYDEFVSLSERLYDDESRRTLALILEYKLTGELPPLYASASASDKGIFSPERYRVYADLGAYTGDTVRAAVDAMPSLSRVYAFEPEPHAYRKLSAYAETVTSPQILTYNAAAWSCDTTLTFTAASGRGSSLSARSHGKTREHAVTARSLDGIVGDDHVDLIKFDVEGAESEAICGASETIRRCRPDLCVSVYHRTEDLLTLPQMISALVPEYRLYLHRSHGVPAWDINLCAVMPRPATH